MRKRKLLAIPKEPKDVFHWIVMRLIMTFGIGSVFGGAALLIAALALFGFLIGDYEGNGKGSLDHSLNGVTLDPETVMKNKALLTHYTDVATSWQRGLTKNQIEQVESTQVDLPGAVLLAIGKMVNNFDPTNAHLYDRYLAPSYTWRTFDDITITHKEVTRQAGRKTVTTCVTVEMRTPVSKLMTANTWDGTLINSYKWVTTHTPGPCGGTVKTKIMLSSSKRTYTWSRVWNLFQHIPATSSGQTFTISETKENEQVLAGLIAAVDYGLTDPKVQEMVSSVLFPGEMNSGPSGPIAPPSTNVIQNILRFKSTIEEAAAKYRIPAVLIAGVMYQESGGREHTDAGGLLISSAGAVGLMQVEPSTAAGMVLNGHAVGDNAYAALANPIMNIELGAMYLSEMYQQFGQDPVLAEAAYNAGPGAVEEALAHGEKIPPYTQTIDYVRNIQGAWIPALTPYFGPDSGTTQAFAHSVP